MFGTATSSDGIPILGEVMSGNTSDMTFRKNLENPDEEPVEGLNRQKTKRPTAYAIEYVLSAILVMRVQKKKCEEWILPKSSFLLLPFRCSKEIGIKMNDKTEIKKN